MRNFTLVAILGIVALAISGVIGMVVIAAVIDGSTAQAVIGYLHDLVILLVPVVLSIAQHYIMSGTQDAGAPPVVIPTPPAPVAVAEPTSTSDVSGAA